MKLQDMMYIALFAAIVGVLGFFPPIPLPFSPVPITAQTLGVMLAGGMLGARRGALSLLLFIALVAIGTPLLTGGRGGLGALIGPGGGYIMSWPLAAGAIGYLAEKSWQTLKLWKIFLFNFIGGIVLVYACGVTYLSFIGNLPWVPTALSALAFLPGDLAKTFVAGYITLKISKVYPLIKIQKSRTGKQIRRVS
ncbi:biotin transport system substrate-specific component [Virgibacillus halotolerans]|uniref:biotin transporter BioY n=1 Tax=Virgibacillus halotolerans TaxID=1071053 RepID=UPI00196220A6|nr:biotin transporter BioY [Virgibacillus halotolerans]MBM7599199.1 biotin transport system substrate-specific component [Virgibacillus halotolerans]